MPQCTEIYPRLSSAPSSLICFAIPRRWTKEQTQLDLSGSTQWFRFMEIFYDRPETPTVPRHTEVVVFFVPDTASTLPNTKDVSCTSIVVLPLMLLQFILQWKEYEKARAEEKKASADHKHANG